LNNEQNGEKLVEPLIVEVASNGGTPKERNPNSPLTPDEIAVDVLECLEAGASVIHTHIDDYRFSGQAACDRYNAGYRQILAKRPDAILYPTATMNDTHAKRIEHIELLAKSGTIRMSYADPGSCNFGPADDNGMPKDGGIVYANPFDEIEYTWDLLSRNKLGPGLSIYEPSFLRAALAYDNAGKLPKGALVKFYLAGDYSYFDGKKGYQFWGLPTTVKAVEAYREMMAGSSLPWAVSALGGDVTASGLSEYAIKNGGHIRLGLEDYGGPRKPKNIELLNEVIAIANRYGRKLATTHEAARILKLPLGPK
jgi:3-keto-5-aminohexanoate cleavage enzyme